MMGKKRTKVDPVTVELIRNALPAVTNEMSYDLQRTSYNMMIYEVRDYCCGLVDTQSRLISQNVGGVSHFVSDLGVMIEDALRKFGVGGFSPGDVIVSNHQRVGGQHLNNMLVYTPFFYKGELICFPMVRAHWTDVGGGSTGFGGGDLYDAWLEGLQLDQIKIYEEGKPDKKALKIISDNIRFPESSMGDLRSQMAACNLALRRLENLFDKYRKDVVLSAIEHVLDDAEAKCRRIVEKIPDGHYEAESFYEDSFSGRMGGPTEPIRIHASITISGSDMTIDFSGCSGQRPSALNSRTKAGAYIPYKAITTPLDPVNEGSFRALKVIIPEGNVMMAKYPAPMSDWSRILPTVVDTVLKALAPAMRDRIPAGHLGTLGSPVVFFGTVPRTGERFIVQSLEGGGWGGRPFEDGPSSSISIIQGDVRNAPAENMELKCPVIINERALRIDSGGPGKFRGGLGLSVRVTNLVGGRWTLGYLGKENFPPWGLWGGKPGEGARDFLKLPHETEFKQVNVMRYFVPANSQAIINSGSGGGWGDPLERDPEKVSLDVREGYVSLQAAEKDYGVVLRSDMTVNYEETTKLREKVASG